MAWAPKASDFRSQISNLKSLDHRSRVATFFQLFHNGLEIAFDGGPQLWGAFELQALTLQLELCRKLARGRSTEDPQRALQSVRGALQLGCILRLQCEADLFSDARRFLQEGLDHHVQ